MKIIVAIKQVPYVDQLKFDNTSKRLVREGVESEINPFDKRALTWAINYKKQSPDSEVIVLTMGPPQAQSALVEALAMGADRAVHLLGREFAGADTLATARALADACRKIGFDLVICGKYATDAETAQVPPMLAELLNLPQVTGATELTVELEACRLLARREVDDGFETIEASLPAVVSAAERLAKPIKVAPGDLEKGKEKPLQVMGVGDLASPSQYGLAGSPTLVSEIYSIEPTRRHIILQAGDNLPALAEQVVRSLVEQGLFGERKLGPGKKNEARLVTSKGPRPSESRRDVWVVSELVEGEIRPATFELLGKSVELAGALGGTVGAVLIGHHVQRQAARLASYGADKVYVADSPALAQYMTEPYTQVVVDAIRMHHPYAVLFPSTANGRDLAPRVAARLQAGLTGDCIGLHVNENGDLVQLKPAFGGNIVAPILSRTRPVLATVRPGMMEMLLPDRDRFANIVTLPTDNIPAPRTRITGREQTGAQSIALDNARVIIGVGMGVGGPENFATVKDLAAIVGAPIAGTRRVVDAGWLPRQMQIGLTGRSVAPDLYIAIGISGKFNHIVGIQRAGIILAVNESAEADIFKQADYGIVGDWARVVPALTKAFAEAKAKSH